jgi:hypothetical protein
MQLIDLVWKDHQDLLAQQKEEESFANRPLPANFKFEDMQGKFPKNKKGQIKKPKENL